MRISLIIGMAVLASGQAYCEEFKSEQMRKVICEDVETYLDEERNDTLDLSVEECAQVAGFSVKPRSKRYKTYKGSTIEIKIGEETFTLKKNQKFLFRLDVTFTAGSFVCQTVVEKSLPRFENSGSDVYFGLDNWVTDVDGCQVEGEAELASVKPGDDNLKVVSSLPRRVRENVHYYDLIPMIGQDGYYDSLEHTFAKIVDSGNKAIGYMMAAAYAYSEDPEVHYWIFIFNKEGKLVETPNEPWTTTGDDWLWEGSTTTLLKGGKLDY